jgi:hypothetical protein
MVTRVEVPAVLFEPRISQPLRFTGAGARLYSSMNSSFPPDGPRVRNSLITMVSDPLGAAGRFVARRPEAAREAAGADPPLIPIRPSAPRPTRRRLPNNARR